MDSLELSYKVNKLDDVVVIAPRNIMCDIFLQLRVTEKDTYTNFATVDDNILLLSKIKYDGEKYFYVIESAISCDGKVPHIEAENILVHKSSMDTLHRICRDIYLEGKVEVFE